MYIILVIYTYLKVERENNETRCFKVFYGNGNVILTTQIQNVTIIALEIVDEVNAHYDFLNRLVLSIVQEANSDMICLLRLFDAEHGIDKTAMTCQEIS